MSACQQKPQIYARASRRLLSLLCMPGKASAQEAACQANEKLQQHPLTSKDIPTKNMLLDRMKRLIYNKMTRLHLVQALMHVGIEVWSIVKVVCSGCCQGAHRASRLSAGLAECARNTRFAFRLTDVQWLRRCWILLSTHSISFLQRLLLQPQETIPPALSEVCATFDLYLLCKASGTALKAPMLF